jgi:intracellular sulfur oxidation DsrE/DsrF family protein
MPFVSAFSEDTADDWERMVFHLDETANARWALMLSNAYLDDSPRAKLVIVAYGPGIDFLIEGAEDRHGNPYEQAVMDLVARGVDFRVCATTLSARDIDKDRLVDGTTTVPSGLTEIARLQLKERYAYVKP